MRVRGVVTVLTFGAVAGMSAQDFEWSGVLERGQVIEIKGIAGSIQVTPTSGPARVVATKYGRESRLDEVTIEMEETRDGITVCAVYPQRRTRSGCRPDHDDLDLDDIRVDVEFEVELPAGIEFDGKTIDGDITVEGATAWVSAMTVNGDVHIETDDVGRAVTVAGSIFASIGSADWNDDLSFTSVSGDITLELDPNIDADVTMTTMSGDVESAFPLTMRSRGFLKMGMRGQLGRGGPDLKLTTLSGDVRLARR